MSTRLPSGNPKFKNHTALLIFLALLWPGRAFAHAWGNSHALPIPFELYAYGGNGCTCHFICTGGLFRRGEHGDGTNDDPWHATRMGRGPYLGRGIHSQADHAVAKIVSVLGLGLTIGAGLFGNPSPFANFSMTFFWVIFVLGFAYLTAFVGDLYALTKSVEYFVRGGPRSGGRTPSRAANPIPSGPVIGRPSFFTELSSGSNFSGTPAPACLRWC